jgi:hypothetical protein
MKWCVLFVVATLGLARADEAKPESVRGHIIGIVTDGAGGILLSCSSEDYLNNNDQTDGFDLQDVNGLVFVYGLPGKDFLDDQHLGLIAVRAGTYRYTTAIGGEKTVAAYKFVKRASKL